MDQHQLRCAHRLGRCRSDKMGQSSVGVGMEGKPAPSPPGVGLLARVGVHDPWTLKARELGNYLAGDFYAIMRFTSTLSLATASEPCSTCYKLRGHRGNPSFNGRMYVLGASVVSILMEHRPTLSGKTLPDARLASAVYTGGPR